MPHMKYFQSIATIQAHYKDILRAYDDETYGKVLLETWGISWNEKEAIKEELDVLEYLISCQHGLALWRSEDSIKPTVELVNRCFNRHIGFLESVFRLDKWNVNKHHSKTIIKEYKACRHYLFKFSCPGCVESPLSWIHAFENKYPKFNETEELLPIPKL